MRPLLNPLPVDWSGKSIANRTKGEIHDLSDQYQLPYRIVVMQSGYFFNGPETPLSIMDERGYQLKEGTDYQTLLLNSAISAISGKAAFALIVVTNESVGNTLYIDAQMVGGIYCRVNQAILEQSINTIVSSNRKVYWKYIKDKPSDFRPSGHLHALWELYGFTNQTNIIRRMTTARHRTFDIIFEDLYTQFNTAFDKANTILDEAKRDIRAHIAQRDNPHRLTKAIVGLSDVIDGPIATVEEAASANGNITYAYATPLRAAGSIAFNFTPKLTAHTTNYNNPHQMTAAQVGAVTIAQINAIASGYVDRGATVNMSMGVYVASQGILSYDAYVKYVRNNIPIFNVNSGFLPHSMVTKSQPGDPQSIPSGSDSFMVAGWGGYMQWLKWPYILSLYSQFVEDPNEETN